MAKKTDGTVEDVLDRRSGEPVEALYKTMQSEVFPFIKGFDFYIRTVLMPNTWMKDLAVLQESPFTDRGSLSELFSDVAVSRSLRDIIEEVNRNAMVA